ncbi:hypothetical protein HPCPY3281_1012 [Helicobacter pylori CPY3281]|nr:hypothetical protein HPCPY3281_1012 [Helicobacter pylori CPY3281]
MLFKDKVKFLKRFKKSFFFQPPTFFIKNTNYDCFKFL